MVSEERESNGLALCIHCLGLNYLTGLRQVGIIARTGEKATVLQDFVNGAVDGVIGGRISRV